MLLINESDISSGEGRVVTIQVPSIFLEKNIKGAYTIDSKVKFNVEIELYTKDNNRSGHRPRFKVFKGNNSRDPLYGVIISESTGLVLDELVIYKNGYKLNSKDSKIIHTLCILANLCREETIAVYNGNMSNSEAYELLDLYAKNIFTLEPGLAMFLYSTARSGDYLTEERIEQIRKAKENIRHANGLP